MLGKASRTALLTLAVAAPSLVYANNFNYNAFQIRLGADPGTMGAEFTTYFTENTHFIVRGDSRFDGDWDVAGGIGFNGPAGQFADVYGQLLVHNIKQKNHDTWDTDFASEFNIGSRIWFLQNVEGDARIGMLNGNDDTKFIWKVGARFHSTDALSIGAALFDNGTYGNQVEMSVAFNF
ncbi:MULTISPECIES: hypothetical protein [Vibrio]|uniref:Porin family protein n=2 Tax=Vibrio mediterranei TaxID=689 RepID=A0AAJ3EQ39_9VIBR|nr:MULTISPECIES: hypothetical protein [Vibrio]ASI92544.1 hypothetical protein BSZ05_22390 [Vibrio mediterranei]KFA97839.1 hypothetical protein HW45_10645 [Vibrio sp. ER1A]MCG9662596.1 hypothetical protein [Vibrio mediterranei]NOH30578.1 hypothetical protein [Vibrio mediterranei]NOI25229.1 hypothetical protein [Vibrio mediterranei]